MSTLTETIELVGGRDDGKRVLVAPVAKTLDAVSSSGIDRYRFCGRRNADDMRLFELMK